jgi:hypothetical protein
VDSSTPETSCPNTLGLNAAGGTSPRDSWGRYSSQSINQSLGLALKVKFYGAVNPVHFLMVPATPIATQPMKAFPKPPATALADNVIEHSHHWRILGRLICVGLYKQKAHDLASLTAGESVLRHHELHRCTLGCRRHNFRDRTTFIAAFSRA